MEQILEFSLNSNSKLNCKSFVVIRLRDDKQFFYGAKFEIRLSYMTKGFATIIDIKYIKLKDVNEFISRLSAEESAESFKSLIKQSYKNNKMINWDTQDLAFLLLRYGDKLEAPLFK